MSKYIPGNQKHLTLDDRKYIENALNKGTTFKDIARFLCKDPTTISKEVKAHRLSDWYVYCKIKLPKVAKQKWTLLQVQIGQSCKGCI